LVTDFTFTGQRAERGFGLMDYNARYYDPWLGRFISADTVVPNYTNPQALNRYSYVLNSPLSYTDPGGHCIPGGNCPGDKNDEVGGYTHSLPPSIPNVEAGASPAFEVSVTRTELGYYNPGLPSTIGAINSAVGVPAGFAAATYNFGRTSGNYIDYMPTMANRIGYGTTLALPLVNGAVNASDINARERAGMVSGNEAILEHTNNAAFTVLNVGSSWFMLEAATPTFTLGATSVGVPTILSSPVTIVAAIPSIGMVTAWEQQTISNMIEGMPRGQAWKEARDTVYEPVLTLFGASREARPEWYWYP
jgi:RHS repeat-associated protein